MASSCSSSSSQSRGMRSKAPTQPMVAPAASRMGDVATDTSPSTDSPRAPRSSGCSDRALTFREACGAAAKASNSRRVAPASGAVTALVAAPEAPAHTAMSPASRVTSPISEPVEAAAK